MDAGTLELCATLITPRYAKTGAEAWSTLQRSLRCLLAQRRAPEDGLSDAEIQVLLRQLALLDSNNHHGHLGAGEREGRVVAELVRQRHFHLAHGIGRSGNLTEDQPKAAGSSIMYALTNAMMLDLVRMAGATSTAAAVVVPMATGMTLALALRAVAQERMEERKSEEGVLAADGAHIAPRYVLWPRVDQKTALKCIDAAGLLPYVVPLRAVVGGGNNTMEESPTYLQVHVDDVEAAIRALGGRSAVLAVLSTTSCFAPRLPDDVIAMAELCHRHNIAYVINNAYGLQSRCIMNRLEVAQRRGRVDFFIQSGDKNLCVPVGGALLCSANAARVRRAAGLYAGRASASPALDLFITALSLGRRGVQRLWWNERYPVGQHLAQELRRFAQARGEMLLADDWADAATKYSNSNNNHEDVAQEKEMHIPLAKDVPRRRKGVRFPRNDISFALTMRHYQRATQQQQGEDSLEEVSSTEVAKQLGGHLFRRGVTGARVIAPSSQHTTILGHNFQSYGAHQDAPPCPMLIVACAAGIEMADVGRLIHILEGLWPPFKATSSA